MAGFDYCTDPKVNKISNNYTMHCIVSNALSVVNYCTPVVISGKLLCVMKILGFLEVQSMVHKLCYFG